MGWFSQLTSGNIGGAFESAAGGVVSGASDVLSSAGDVATGAVNAIGDVGQSVINQAQNLGRSIDDVVNQIPGGWATVAAATGIYFRPEIEAYFNGLTGEVVSPEAALAAADDVAAQQAAASAMTGATPISGVISSPTLAEDVAAQQAAASAMPTVTPISGMAPDVLADEVAAQQAAAASMAGATPLAAIAGETLADDVAAQQAAAAGMAGAGLADAAGAGAAGAAAGGAIGNAAAGAAGAAAGNKLTDALPYIAGGAVASGLIGADAAKSAAQAQVDAANRAAETQKYIFDTLNQQQAPYREAGYSALKDIQGQLPYLTSKYTPEDFAKNIDPGYAFRLKQGQMAAERAGNIRGMTGNVLTGLQDYTQGLASQEYANAFQRNLAQKQNIYNTLAGIAGLGQTAQGQTTTAAGNYGTNVANLMTGGAAAQAAGQIGQANALTGALGNVMNTYTLANLLGQTGKVA